MLENLPKAELAFLPTPLTPMRRLESLLGPSAPALYIKRDDCTGLAFGGNKTRKLEFLLGDAVEKQADTVVTVGATQSNHVRQTAAACAALGLRCEVFLSQSVPRTLEVYQRNGNVLLNECLGATIHRVASPSQTPVKVNQRIQQLKEAGHSPYFIPTGGSNSLGAMGYVQAVKEIVSQCGTMNISGKITLIHASASGGTQAGLIAGNAMLGNPINVIGVNVYKQDNQEVLDNIRTLVSQLHGDYALDFKAEPQFTLWHGYQGEAYGIATQAGDQALLTLARMEGILADPVYSGKALSGLVEKCKEGYFSPADRVIFLHTGGATSLHAYPDIL